MVNWPMPNGGPTPVTRIVGRGLCVLMYSLSFTVAVGDYFAAAGMLHSAPNRAWTIGFCLAVAALSTVGLVAVLAHRWRIEWTPATALTFLLLARCAPIWDVATTGQPKYLAAAALMTLGALLLGKRALDLWMFFAKTKQSADRAGDERR